MKCDDFLPALASGGMLERVRAHWHASRCADCARVRERWQAAERDWANPTATTPAERQLWESAAGDLPLPRPSRTTRVPRRVLVAAACALVIGAVLVLSSRSRDPEIRPLAKNPTALPTAPEQRVAQARDDAQIEEMRRGLDQLALELNELAKQAELIDVRKKANQLSIIYQPLGLTRDHQATPN